MSSETQSPRRHDERAVQPAAMNPLQLDLLCAMPRLLSDVSAWVQHIPFAFSLVQMLRPRRVVELGTHKGDSYCAMCQAVDQLGLDTQCTAVDTWRGDPQCGTYDERIFHELQVHHDPLYGRFSTLLRSTFDAAVDHFEDGSIDLLHLDGLHHYAAVRHDFERWLPKLSDRAVVLLHDTEVRTGDFGVYRLWEELRAGYLHFGFEHGCGLGVIAVGKQVPEDFRRFLAAGERSPDLLRQLFSALGQRLELTRGIGLLAGDVTIQEAEANAWRTFAGQTLRRTLPAGVEAGRPLKVDRDDLKIVIDGIHETSFNHLDEMLTLVADNRNLRRLIAEARNEMATLRLTSAGRADGNVVGDSQVVMETLRLMAEERMRQRAAIVALGQTLELLQGERRGGTAVNVWACLASCLWSGMQATSRGVGAVLRGSVRCFSSATARPKILGLTRRVPPL